MKAVVLLAAGAAIALGTAFATARAQAADFKLVCAHDQPAEGQRAVAWQAFKMEVEAKSKGRIEVQVIGAGQLGDMPQILQNMKLGTVDCTSIDAATSGPFIPSFSFVGTPYLVTGKKHADLLVDPNRPFFKEVAGLVKSHLQAQAVGSESYPPRHAYTRTKPITEPEDLKGLKMRTMQSPAQVKSWQTLGATPSPVAFAEVYAALQTGVVDAAECQLWCLWGMKHYEQVKYLSLTSHLINLGVLSIGDRGMAKLPDDLKKVVVDAGAVAGAAGIKYVWETDAEFLERIKKAGVIVNEVDVRPFVAKLATVHDELAKEFKAEALLKILREEAAVAAKM